MWTFSHSIYDASAKLNRTSIFFTTIFALVFVLSTYSAHAIESPVLTVTKNSNTSVKISWAISSNISTRNALLIVQRSSGGRRFVAIGEFSNPKRKGSYIDSLLPNGNYRYRARLKTPVRSAWSTVRSVSVSSSGGFATPQPTLRPRYFDGNGDVTPLGKQQFEIPASRASNITRGRLVWTSACSGCHQSEKRDRTFSYLKVAIAGPPMFVVVSDANLADLVGFLNRFRVP